jgi:hypothetical protein
MTRLDDPTLLLLDEGGHADAIRIMAEVVR